MSEIVSPYIDALKRYKLQVLGTCFSVLVCPVFISKFEYEFLIIDAAQVPLVI